MASRLTRRRRRSRAAAALLAASLLATVAPAGADIGEGDSGGEETPGGFSAYVIDWEGHYDSARVSAVPQPPPVCWWTRPHLAADPTDAGAWRDAYREYQANAVWDQRMVRELELPGGLDALDRAYDADQTEPGIRWWWLRYDQAQLDDDDYVGDLLAKGCTEAAPNTPGFPTIPIAYRYRPVNEVPAPLVDMEALARHAYVALDLVLPTLDWNPRMTGNDDATLVNFPTWVWVEQPAALQERTVRARVRGTDLWVEVSATTDSLEVASPAGGARCTADRGRYLWSAGRDEKNACVVRFHRESHGLRDGFDLRASTTWRATWTASTGEGGTFDPRTITAQDTIRVVSTQSIVTGVN
ncbi:hypothetical protein [Nocardioides jishulii]|uniref:Secreted protein n=1 Tax=Nocardioides jishulii TaxID=2575440 RepID=A0A4U2YTK9_9ACTN|nr:hypothetical protein [Nocardioides jishulii]QCX28290.1 hypothetical protein FCL41_12745 [Nocardioides jishulii]TKI64817.1 hypothetical protein FC770_06825 [Nocardioides jishulii]